MKLAYIKQQNISVLPENKYKATVYKYTDCSSISRK